MTVKEPAAPFHALLVEGIPGIGKSTLVDALIRRHVDSAESRRIRTLVHLSQAHTYGPLASAEDDGTLTLEDHLRHLERVLRYLEWLNASVADHTRPSCFVLIDTLHLTHCLRPGRMTWEDAVAFDHRLASVGCKLLLLQASAEVVWKRSIKARTDWSFLREYAAKFGRTDEELHAYFLGEQERFASMFRQSKLVKLSIRNDAHLESILDEAYTFWRGQDP
jgi:thymidylate kinase